MTFKYCVTDRWIQNPPNISRNKKACSWKIKSYVHTSYRVHVNKPYIIYRPNPQNVLHVGFFAQ
jgi:hypothetical protein